MNKVLAAASFIYKLPKAPTNSLIAYSGFRATNKITDIAAKNLPGLLTAKPPISRTGALVFATSVAQANPAFALLLCSIVRATTAALLKNRHYTPEQFKRCLADPNYKFPPNPIVDDDLDLDNWTNLTSLPKGLRVEGHLSLKGCTSLTSVPEGLYVGGSLYLDGCTSLTSLPKGVHVDGTLYLDGCTGLVSLSEGLYVGASLFLKNCTRLISLPERLHVQYLYLNGCTSLTSLPQGLHVDVDLDLRDCIRLASLPQDLHVGRNLNLSDCIRLASLPEGLCIINGSLHLNGCIGLRSLPEGLRVKNILSLKGCISLVSLPQGLRVDVFLDLSDCISLVSLPEDLHVGYDLFLRHCTSLTSLPQKLHIDGDLYLQGCTNLTSLPAWITQLGLKPDGQVRAVYLIGTGLSENIINRLRQTDAPGMQFYYSHAASAPHKAFKSLDEALEFWKEETKNTDLPLPKVMFASHELLKILEFLGRLTETAEYKNVKSRSILASRVMKTFKLMAENKDIKSRSYDAIYHGLTTCHDRVISALDEIELMGNIYQLENSNKMNETELRELGKRYLLLDMVNKKADEHKKTLAWVDEIEIYLAFQTVLADKLNLPLLTRNMLFRGCAQITTDELEKIGDKIKEECTPDAVEKFLSTWSPWIKFHRRNAVPSYDALKSIPATEEKSCSITGDTTQQPVMYDKRIYDYDAFAQWFIENVGDPFTRQPIDLSKLVRVALPCKGEIK